MRVRWMGLLLAGTLASSPSLLLAQRPNFGLQVDLRDGDVGVGGRLQGGAGRLIPGDKVLVIGSFDLFSRAAASPRGS